MSSSYTAILALYSDVVSRINRLLPVSSLWRVRLVKSSEHASTWSALLTRLHLRLMAVCIDPRRNIYVFFLGLFLQVCYYFIRTNFLVTSVSNSVSGTTFCQHIKMLGNKTRVLTITRFPVNLYLKLFNPISQWTDSKKSKVFLLISDLSWQYQ